MEELFKKYLMEENLEDKYSIGPQLSYPQLQYAKNEILNFFKNDKKPLLTCYGTTSGGLTGHYLYKNEHNIIYTFYASNKIHHGFKTTKTFIEDIFLDYNDNNTNYLQEIDLSILQ